MNSRIYHFSKSVVVQSNLDNGWSILEAVVNKLINLVYIQSLHSQNVIYNNLFTIFV